MFDPKGFIDIARELAVDKKTEAEYRTATSRALYGVFLIAREELESRGERVKVSSPGFKGDEHSKVRAKFKSGKFAHSYVSQRLGSLYDLRYLSDYNLTEVIGLNDVKQALECVDYIQRAFNESLFKRPPTN